MSCGHKVDLNEKFCYLCGSIQSRTICACSHANPIEAKFCGHCGQELKDKAKEESYNAFDNYVKYSLKELQAYAENNPIYIESAPVKLSQSNIQDRINAKSKRSP